MKEIKGSISYTLQISDSGEWTVTYGTEGQSEEDSVHNDIASLVIAQNVMEQCAATMKLNKESLKGRDKKYMTQKLDKVIDGRFGLKLIADYLIDCYEGYMEFLSKKASDKEANPKAEQVTMTEEEIKMAKETHDRLTNELVKGVLDKYPDHVNSYKEGQTGLLGMFVGEAMKASKGKIDPKYLNNIVKNQLDGL